MFPDSNDTLIKFQIDNQFSSVIGANWQDWSWYSHSYDLAIRTLIEHTMAEKKHGQLLTLPIIFLSRHFIEIKLKEILDSLELKIPTTHNLEKLWADFHNTYKVQFKSDNEEELDDLVNTGRIIIELNSIDEKSFNFRYPTDKRGNKSLKFGHFDLLNFISIIEKVSLHLDSVKDYIEDC